MSGKGHQSESPAVLGISKEGTWRGPPPRGAAQRSERTHRWLLREAASAAAAAGRILPDVRHVGLRSKVAASEVPRAVPGHCGVSC